MVRFYLESLVEGGRQLRRIAVHPLPFRVGRTPGLSLSLASESVSKEHAEIVMREDALYVQDLGSKNGTFLKEARVTAPVALANGDAIRVGSVALTVRKVSTSASTVTDTGSP